LKGIWWRAKAWLGVSKVAFENPYSNISDFFAILTIIKP
jgi:hypothetical protein